MAKRISIRGIKKNLTYTVEELADITHAVQPTVRNWIREGLLVIDDIRPTLILGFYALDFLGKKQTKAKRQMAFNELYCMRCKDPRTPYGMMADYYPDSAFGPRLVALCGECDCQCYRNINANQLSEFSRVLDIAIRGSE